MNLNEAKQILEANGYKLINEFFGFGRDWEKIKKLLIKLYKRLTDLEMWSENGEAVQMWMGQRKINCPKLINKIKHVLEDEKEFKERCKQQFFNKNNAENLYIEVRGIATDDELNADQRAWYNKKGKYLDDDILKTSYDVWREFMKTEAPYLEKMFNIKVDKTRPKEGKEFIKIRLDFSEFGK